MERKYAVFVDDQKVDHLEGKQCKQCGALVSFSHQEPCRNCGGTEFKDAVIYNKSDLDPAARAKPERYPPMGGTD